MARRLNGATFAHDGDDGDDSLKENAHPDSQSRPRAGKGRDREPQPAAGPSDGPDVDADGSSADEDAGKGSSKGRKRARVNGNGDARPMTNGHSSKGKGRARPVAQPLARHPDKFVPGSITRVKLHNFVTYDDVEFHPGPHLNMIIGPNGTGKSSIACAIALGLNWPPSILGRANELPMFVKNTKEEGFIEIELKGNIGQPNVVIKRTLSSKSKASAFYVDGRPSTGREITQTMNQLNIQVGNLCSFLPQDRVSEFAQMSPQQLLRETQRAAGDEHLTNWHDTLIIAGKERKELAELLESDRKQLETLRDRNENLEREVQRFRERKEIEKRIAVLETVMPFLEYYEVRDRYREAKIKQRDLHACVTALKRKTQPIEQFKRRLEGESRRLSEQREQKKRVVRKHLSDLQRTSEENDNLTSTAEDAHSKLDNLKKNEKARLKRIGDLEKNNAALRRELDQPVEMEDPETIADELRKLNAMTSTLSQKRIDLSDRQARNVDTSSRWKAELQEGTKALQQADNMAFQKLENLKRTDPDCYATIMWLRENRHRFREEIVEPAIVTLTVPNRTYADAIEACFASHQLRTFVAQNDDDYRLLNQLVVDTTEALGRQARIPTTLTKPTGAEAPQPLTKDQLKELGFDGWAIDLVSCPPGLNAFLRQAVHLHRTAIGVKNPARIDTAKVMDIVARSGGANYVIGRTMNTVMKSQYGRRLAQNVTREIKQARALVGMTISRQWRLDCERKINQAQENLKNVDAEAEELANEDRELKDQEREHKKAHTDLAERKHKIQAKKNQIARHRHKLEQDEAKLAQLKTQPPPDAERARLKAFLAEIAKKRVLLVEKYLNIAQKLRKEQAENTLLGLKSVQLGSNLTALEVLITERNAAYQETLDLWQAACKVYNDLKDESIAKKTFCEAKLDEADDEVREEMGKISVEEYSREHTSDHVQTEIAEQQSKLELVMEANPGAVEQYERRKAEIETLAKKVEERAAKSERTERTIQNARDRWLPALQQLVASIGEKFSAAFERIGCTGELELTEHEDYDKWAITIWVKFRDEAQLQKLTPHRQSGGERSLTTIMYLMSMTEQARSPFSLVDEINQGMDRRAERVIHNQLVQTTCETECGQYFLITPKLLRDLQYHKRMKVLCVNNGEWLPTESIGGNMMAMVQAYLAHSSRSDSGPSTAVGP